MLDDYKKIVEDAIQKNKEFVKLIKECSKKLKAIYPN
jgi:uncharacterized protein YeeX (DUF496 family)